MKEEKTWRYRDTQGALWIVTLIAIGIALIMTAMQPAKVDNEDQNTDHRFEPPVLMFSERVASVAQAEQITGVDISLPSWLPEDYSLQAIFIDRGTGRMQLVFGSSPLSSSGTLLQSEVMAKGYWILMIADGMPDVQSYIDYVVELNQGRTEAVKIGGYPGLITCPGDGGNYVAWWMKGRVYELMTSLGPTAEDLLRFCESVAQNA